MAKDRTDLQSQKQRKKSAAISTSSKAKASLSALSSSPAPIHPVVRVYALRGSTFISRTFSFDIGNGIFISDGPALATGVIETVNDVRRIVFFATGTLSGSETPLLVADVSPGGVLRVSGNRKEISLDAKVLCALDSSGLLNPNDKIDFEWKAEAQKKAGQNRPVHKSFEIRDELLNAVTGDPPDKLAELLELPQSRIPKLLHNGFSSRLLKEATALSIPEFKPPNCGSGVRQETIISFPKLSDLSDKAESFRVIVFELRTQDQMTCNGAGGTGMIRLFEGGDDGRFEYKRGEAPAIWRFVQRPTIEISSLPPKADLVRGANWVLHVFGVPSIPVAKSWNRFVEKFHLFLRGTQGSRSVSFLPLFEPDESTPNEKIGHWQMSYRLTDGSSDDRPIFLDGDTNDEADKVAIRPLSLHFTKPIAAGAAPLKGRLPQILTTEGTPLSNAEFKLVAFLPETLEALGDVEDIKFLGINMRLPEPVEVKVPVAVAGQPSNRPVVRVGALDLDFGRSGASQGNKNDLRLGPLGNIVLIETNFNFFLKALTPGGQDYSASEEFVPSGDENDCLSERIRPKPPIVVPLAPRTATTPKLLLNVRQEYQVKKEPPHVLNLDILSQDPKKGSFTNICADAERFVVVLDRNPFLVAEVRYPDFDRLSSFAGSKIATWNSSGLSPKWELLFEEQPFCLVLPPQAIGEEMLKGDKAEQEIGAGALPFNLGPPTSMEVDARQVRTNFAEAPWNLRRILGTRGEPLAGPLVKRLHYELLYGLTGDAANPGIRLADVFSQAGRIAGMPDRVMAWVGTDPQITNYATNANNWSKIYARYLARAAVLVPWNSILLDPDQPSVVLSESLSCRLRLPPNSNMKAPIDLETGGPDGRLRGGATWGFESKNIYKAVLDNQPSSSARLENFSFSALGGWGEQQAAFQNDLSRISGDVAMGRAYRYKVERLGRIACVWHLAKHVIIYERSVVPSSQFNDPLQMLAGWPILRKVKEYVELLDDKRNFPDDEQVKDAEAIKRARGFVTDCTFEPGARFNVHGSWGSDVGDYGWKIPIWRPGAQPAHLYPKPRVSFGTATNVSNEQGSHNCDCENPDNFYFFTLTRDPVSGANPDRDPRKWPPILGVDFVNAPRPRPSTLGPVDFVDGDPRATSPTDSAVPPLYGPCTFRLKPASVPADVVAERAGKAMAAVIQTITLSRSVEPDDTKSWSGAISEFTKVEEGLAIVYNAVLKSLPLDALPTDADIAALTAKVNTDFADYAAKFQAATAAITDLKTKLVQRIDQAETATIGRLRANLDKAAKDALDELDASIDALIAGGFNGDKAKRLLLEHQHQVEEIFLLINSLPGVVPELLARYVDVIIGLTKQIDEGLANAEKAIATDIELARKELTAPLESARALIESFNTLGLTRPLPFLPDPTAAVRAELKRYVEGFATFEASAKRLFDELRLAANPTSARQAIANFKASAFYTKLKNPQELHDFIKKAFGKDIDVTNPVLVREAVHFARKWRDDVVDKWRVTAKEAVLLAQQNETKLREAQTKVRNWLKTTGTGLNTELQTLETETQNRINEAKTFIKSSLDSAVAELKLTDIQTRIRNALSLPKGVIEAKLKEQRDALVEQSRRYFEQATGLFQDVDPTAAKEIFQKADRTLKLLRAFGEPPRVPKLEFDRPQIAYFFKDKLPNVDLTPVASIVSQAASITEKLKPLGVKLPTKQALEQLIPVDLKQFDLTRVFPNFAGLDLRNLFSGVKLDNVGSDNIKITHGIDQQTRRAFVRADVKFELDKEITLFTIGPMSLRLTTADFEATSIVDAGVDGSVRRKVFGRIGGDWQLVMSGIVLLKFKKTELRFDDASGIHFSINPRNIEMPELLAFLSELVNIAGGDGSQGFSIGLMPTGVRAILSLPLPDMQAGAFGISNLRLSAIMALEFDSEFAISIGFGLARREAPFSLTIFLLGGGGFFEVTATYLTKSRRLTCRVDLGITVSASIAIALGPIKGGVYIYLGITATYRNDSGLALGVMVLVRGEVSVLGIVSASITLLLEASYNTQTKAITGRGRLSIKIKICWCFTLEVSHEVSYTLGKSSDTANLITPGTPFPNLDQRSLTASQRRSLADERHNAHAGSLIPPPVQDQFDIIAKAYFDLLV